MPLVCEMKFTYELSQEMGEMGTATICRKSQQPLPRLGFFFPASLRLLLPKRFYYHQRLRLVCILIIHRENKPKALRVGNRLAK